MGIIYTDFSQTYNYKENYIIYNKFNKIEQLFNDTLINDLQAFCSLKCQNWWEHQNSY